MATLNIDTAVSSPRQSDEALRAILDSLARIKFGSISITLHEGKVVQLDVTEKRRLAR